MVEKIIEHVQRFSNLCLTTLLSEIKIIFEDFEFKSVDVQQLIYFTLFV